MPKSYVEVGCSNTNVMGEEHQFLHLCQQSKKESEVGKMGSSNEVCKLRWQPLVSKGGLCTLFLECFVTGKDIFKLKIPEDCKMQLKHY